MSEAFDEAAAPAVDAELPADYYEGGTTLRPDLLQQLRDTAKSTCARSLDRTPPPLRMSLSAGWSPVGERESGEKPHADYAGCRRKKGERFTAASRPVHPRLR
jgi:hypothetical protein